MWVTHSRSRPSLGSPEADQDNITSVPILVKIDQEMLPWECRQTDRYTWHTHWQTQTDFIICPMLYAIAMAQIMNNYHIFLLVDNADGKWSSDDCVVCDNVYCLWSLTCMCLCRRVQDLINWYTAIRHAKLIRLSRAYPLSPVNEVKTIFKAARGKSVGRCFASVLFLTPRCPRRPIVPRQKYIPDIYRRPNS